jgi:hypothetical protein
MHRDTLETWTPQECSPSEGKESEVLKEMYFNDLTTKMKDIGAF